MSKSFLLLLGTLLLVATSCTRPTRFELAQAAYYSPVLEHAPQYAPYYPRVIDPNDPYLPPAAYSAPRPGYSKNADWAPRP